MRQVVVSRSLQLETHHKTPRRSYTHSVWGRRHTHTKIPVPVFPANDKLSINTLLRLPCAGAPHDGQVWILKLASTYAWPALFGMNDATACAVLQIWLRQATVAWLGGFSPVFVGFCLVAQDKNSLLIEAPNSKYVFFFVNVSSCMFVQGAQSIVTNWLVTACSRVFFFN